MSRDLPKGAQLVPTEPALELVPAAKNLSCLHSAAG